MPHRRHAFAPIGALPEDATAFQCQIRIIYLDPEGREQHQVINYTEDAETIKARLSFRMAAQRDMMELGGYQMLSYQLVSHWRRPLDLSALPGGEEGPVVAAASIRPRLRAA